MKAEVSNELNNILQKAGWYANRRISLDRLWKSLLEYDGEFIVLDTIADFYREFGELQFDFYNVITNKEDVIEINFDKATELLFKGDVTEEYLPKIRANHLIPLGYWSNSARILLMDESGKLYLGADEYLALLGNNFLDALHNIVTGKEPLMIIQ